jgi:carboxymethylenebutenolidase
MLIKSSYKDVPTTSNGKKGTMRVHILEPNVPDYPDAKFPGCVVFSEIYQVTGPVERCVAGKLSIRYSYRFL